VIPRLFAGLLKQSIFLFALALSSGQACQSEPVNGVREIPQCTDVSLSAAYLARSSSGSGPGFLLTIRNERSQAIRIAKPFPTSAHWYAQAPSGRWLWRASSGTGGELVNALRERGPLFAYRASASGPGSSLGRPAEYITVKAHGQLQWAASMQSNPALTFRPGCERCSNPQDKRFQAVLAYAYIPPPGPAVEGLLTCGLRSGPIVMPPLD
jgi:hypothetical protein